jgi:hypothetical protein
MIVFASFLMFVSVVPQLFLAGGSTAGDLIVAASSAPTTTTSTSVTGGDIGAALTQAKADWISVVPDAALSAVTATSSDLGGLQLGYP